MRESRIKDNQISDVNELEIYLSEKANNHKQYKYYSKSQYIETILNTNAVYFSNGENWNDTSDGKDFTNSDTDYYKYALCLSYSASESVAMWLLYSGNDGCMIEYNKEIIKSILNAKKVILGFFENDKFVKKEQISKNNFKIEITDVLYYGESKEKPNDCYYVKRSDEVNKEFPKNLVDEMCFKKKRISWSYENECRIIVSIKKDIIKTKYKNLKIILPTEYKNTLLNAIYDSTNRESNIYKESSLKKDLNWELCRKCNNKNKTINS